MKDTVTFKTPVRLDTVTSPKASEELKAIVAVGVNRLVIDMTETEYISSMGLRTVFEIQKLVQKNGGTILVRNLQPMVMKVFEITGFADIIYLE